MSAMWGRKTAKFAAHLEYSTLTTVGMERLSSLQFGVWIRRFTLACPRNRTPGFPQNQAVIINQSGLKPERFRLLGMSDITLNGS